MTTPSISGSRLTSVRVQAAITALFVLGATLFVVLNLRPGLWFESNTPTGGDLGGHVWSAAYLRDVLLPAGRLTGWSPDWYAGFPAFSFYMVIPSLIIVIINIGLPAIWAVPTVVAIPVVLAVGLRRFRPPRAVTAWICAIAAVVCLLVVPVDYGIAMKLVVVAGMVTLPAAAYTAGRMGGIAFPGPAVMALMTLPFLFDRSFNIYGGNLMSTMAGEFAYSLGLTVALVYAGVAARGMQTGRLRGPAAVLLALVGLTHLFVAFLALVITAALFLTRPGVRGAIWVAVVGTLSALVSAFWVLPFYWNRSMLNDMGWGKERRYTEALWSRAGGFGDQDFLANDLPLQIFVVAAGIGTVVFGLRGVRFAMALCLTAGAFALTFLYLPEGRLWNVRLLPFYYLLVYLTAGLTVAELGRWLARMLGSHRPKRSEVWVPVVSATPAVVAALVILVALALPLRSLPGGSFRNDSGEYGWPGLSTTELNLGPSWVSHNFSGYEGAAGWPEYTALMNTMSVVGNEHGCGRALWEYERERLNSYGTPMAPMLLPYWTDGCVGSMEGLYFEASATTPYHFLLQSELSAKPSRAQRDLPYSEFDVASGVGHLRDLGVRYYLASSELAVAAARAEPGLVEIARSDPWVVFSVLRSELVSALDHLPVVIDDLNTGSDWLVATVAWWNAEDVPVLAADGPGWWPTMSMHEIESELADGDQKDRVARMRSLAQTLPGAVRRTPVAPAEVSDVQVDRSFISFTVDMPGRPVLVRTSWFPNWSASGATGPYRVAPNLMVVVPTDTEVVLSYGRSSVEIVGIVGTLIGLVAVLLVGRLRVFGRDRRLWDLVTEPVVAQGSDEVTALALGGGLNDDDVARFEGVARKGTIGALLVAGLGFVGVIYAAVVVSAGAVPTDSPAKSLVVLAPAVIALAALVFWALPRLFVWQRYRSAVVDPACLLARIARDGGLRTEPVVTGTETEVGDEAGVHRSGESGDMGCVDA